jgi:hypothetical protein
LESARKTNPLRQAADAAAGLLLAQRIRRLRVDPRALTYRESVYFDTVEHYCRHTTGTMDRTLEDAGTRDGFTLILRRGGRVRYFILYQATLHPARISFTLAHEVGHILLGHGDDSPAREAEADCFAAALLAPRVLLWELARRRGRRLTPEELCGIFAVSRQAAAVQLAAWQAKPDFSETEQRLLRLYGGLLPLFGEPSVSF